MKHIRHCQPTLKLSSASDIDRSRSRNPLLSLRTGSNSYNIDYSCNLNDDDESISDARLDTNQTYFNNESERYHSNKSSVTHSDISLHATDSDDNEFIDDTINSNDIFIFQSTQCSNALISGTSTRFDDEAQDKFATV
jgi:hypothetical protein